MSESGHARRAGVLLHPTSLPSRFGSGDFGHEAWRFIEWLDAAGARMWQILPLGPTHRDLSPYDALSAHAGNPMLLSLDWLLDRGLLDARHLAAVASGELARVEALRVAASAFHALLQQQPELEAQYDEFRNRCAHWLGDFALFVSLREESGDRPWFEWAPALRDRQARALEGARVRLAQRVAALCFEQFVFERQWRELRAHAARHGVLIFGDMPIFVAHDSADVWACREMFRLDEKGMPTVCAGVPPDYFSEDGQFWGNPHYDWSRMREDGFAWWRRRLLTQRERFDIIRIDHFRGFESCWEIAPDAPGAKKGRWARAPGSELLEVLCEAGGEGTLVAENLGVITDEVEALRRHHRLAGMRVLQFGFDGSPHNPHLPHNHEIDEIVYTATHDNDTTLGWYLALDEHTRRAVDTYLGHSREAMPWPLVRAALASVASSAVIPMQDLLALDSAHRMNRPGVAAGNWRWQMPSDACSPELAARFRDLVRIYGR